jgi:hypothetical protein
MGVMAALAMPAAAVKPEPGDSEIQEIIRKFAAKESDFAKAREVYTYRQLSRIQEVGPKGGKWEEEVEITFDGQGRKEEKVKRAPVQNLQFIVMTPADLVDLRDTQPFVLTTREIDKYHVRFIGIEQIDEIECYVFAVKPKKMEKGLRYFSGLIYVDDESLQIVKSYGRGVGVQQRKGGEAFPKFETFRDQIDGKYWFPVMTLSNDVLYFDSGPVPIKMTVKYDRYQLFGAESKITFGDVADLPPATANAPGGAGSGASPGASASEPAKPKEPEVAPLIVPRKKKKN